MKKVTFLLLMLIITCPNIFSATPSEVYSDSRMLVVCHEKFKTAMEPFVLHKNELGLKTDMIVIQYMDEDSLQTYINDYVDKHADLKFLLLVGDFP